MRITSVADVTRTHISRRVVTPQAALDDLEYDFDFSYDAAPQGHLVLANIVSNSLECNDGADTEVFGPGQSFLVCRPGLPYKGVVHRARMRQLTLDPDLLDQVAGTAEGSPQIEILDSHPRSAQAGVDLRRTFAYVRSTVLAGGITSPLLASSAVRLLAAGILQAFPNTYAPAVDQESGSTPPPDTVRLGVAFIEANPDVDLSVRDIAGAARVTPRALQSAFRRHLDTTPMAYLRQVRLDHARADLLAAVPGDRVTVTRIAGRWGFSSSRFSQIHLATYGEHPSVALAR
jgi:AraC-like DNA-binding protein